MSDAPASRQRTARKSRGRRLPDARAPWRTLRRSTIRRPRGAPATELRSKGPRTARPYRESGAVGGEQLQWQEIRRSATPRAYRGPDARSARLRRRASRGSGPRISHRGWSTARVSREETGSDRPAQGPTGALGRGRPTAPWLPGARPDYRQPRRPEPGRTRQATAERR